MPGFPPSLPLSQSSLHYATLWAIFLMLMGPFLFIVNYSKIGSSRADLFGIFQLPFNAQSFWIAQRHIVGLCPKTLDQRYPRAHTPPTHPQGKKLLIPFLRILCSYVRNVTTILTQLCKSEICQVALKASFTTWM